MCLVFRSSTKRVIRIRNCHYRPHCSSPPPPPPHPICRNQYLLSWLVPGGRNLRASSPFWVMSEAQPWENTLTSSKAAKGVHKSRISSDRLLACATAPKGVQGKRKAWKHKWNKNLWMQIMHAFKPFIVTPSDSSLLFAQCQAKPFNRFVIGTMTLIRFVIVMLVIEVGIQFVKLI